MNISIGIVGLPNVGKSTLFNALTKSQVLAANYPFATIDPNVGIVPIRDARLEKLSEMSKSKETIPAVVEFVDIAGLVKGASQGEGLGNQFLSHIREVAAIVHLVRLFSNDNIIHVNGKVDPKDDIATINTELMLKDMETIDKLITNLERTAKTAKDEKTVKKLELYKRIKSTLESGMLAIKTDLADDEKNLLSDLFLLTFKPVIYCVNVDEDKLNISDEDIRKELGLSDEEVVMAISAQIESELAQLEEDERNEFLNDLGVKESGIERLAKKAYYTLGLINYFTTGDKETRAWTIKKGILAPQAAGTIHTDFEHKFISLECCLFDKFVETGGWVQAKEKGFVRLEGKTYEVKDGDIVVVRHS